MGSEMCIRDSDEINRRMPDLKDTMYHAYTLQGKMIKSLTDLHSKCQIIVVSADSRFKGIRGLEKFSVDSDERPRQDTSLVHPKPRAWIQGSTI